MVEEKIAGKKVKLYDSIDELPITRFHAFNKYLLVDSGIGSDINDINDHIFKVSKYIDSGDKENAKKQLENMRQSLFLIASEINYKHLSIGPMIHSINGVVRDDLSAEGIKETVDLIKKTKTNLLNRLIEAVKKKNRSRTRPLFPWTF